MTTQELINKIITNNTVIVSYTDKEGKTCTEEFTKENKISYIEIFINSYPDCKLQESFIPTHFFNTITEEWESVDNEIEENWIEDETWTNGVKSIIPFGEFIMVIWKFKNNNDRYTTTMYKGTLNK